MWKITVRYYIPSSCRNDTRNCFFFPLTFSLDAINCGTIRSRKAGGGKLFITSPSDQFGVSPRTIVKARFTVSAHKTPTTKLWDGPLLHKYSRNVSVMVQLRPSLTCRGSSFTVLLPYYSARMISIPSPQNTKNTTLVNQTRMWFTHTHTRVFMWLHTAQARNIGLQIFQCVTPVSQIPYTEGRTGSNCIQTIEPQNLNGDGQSRNVPLRKRRYNSTHS